MSPPEKPYGDRSEEQAGPPTIIFFKPLCRKYFREISARALYPFGRKSTDDLLRLFGLGKKAASITSFLNKLK